MCPNESKKKTLYAEGATSGTLKNNRDNALDDSRVRT